MDQDTKKTLWATADKLRSNMDAAEYKHVVLGLIFLKYISDAFQERRNTLAKEFTNPKSDLYIGAGNSADLVMEDRDYYTEEHVFWVPPTARWEAIRSAAKQPDIGKRIDDALIAIEQDNPTLKGVLDKRFGKLQLEPGRLGELIDLISQIGFGSGDKAKDVLGEVYEYFLGQFASAEGKKGGQFYTPGSVVRVLVEESRLEFFKKATDGTVTKEDCEGSLYLHFFFPMLKRIMQVTSGVWETPPVKDGISPQASLGACMPLQRKVLITEEGKLFVCEKDAEGPCLGNVIDGIDYTKVKALLEDLSEFTSKCSTCWVAPICQTCFVQIPRETYRHGRKSTCDKKRTSAEESMMEYFKLLEHKAAYQMVIDLYGDSWVAV